MKTPVAAMNAAFFSLSSIVALTACVSDFCAKGSHECPNGMFVGLSDSGTADAAGAGGTAGHSGSGAASGGGGTSTTGGTGGNGAGGQGTGGDGGTAGSVGTTGGNGGTNIDGGPDADTPAPCNGACANPTPVCNETTNTCVECLVPGDCDPGKPVCEPSTNICVQCASEADCDGNTPFCSTSHTCVACLENSSCTEATASLCQDGTCTTCAGNGDCSHIAGKGVCDAGACVECTVDDASACNGNPCNPVTKTCSAYGTNRLACQSCDTDANCFGTDNYCVPMEYLGVDRPGGYCLKDRAAGTCTKPYFEMLGTRTTLSGVAGKTFCGINETLTTCEAVRALANDGLECPGGTNAECPEGGLCRTVGGTANVCTYACGGAAECLTTPTPGSTCGGGMPETTPAYCGG